MITSAEKERLCRACELLYRASQKIRILTSVSWSGSVRQAFFESGARELPIIEYPRFDASVPLGLVTEACRYIGTSPNEQWLKRQADDVATSGRMLQAMGTVDFYKYSCELYGAPTDLLPDESTTSLALARQFDKTIAGLSGVDLGAPPAASVSAYAVAEEITIAVKRMFGTAAPDVEVVEELSSNALAGPGRIRIRRGATFTDRDANQLIQHEAFIHVATSLNGLAQKNLPLLAAAHPGTTRTQEGLAVFAELITGSIDLDRLRRLADRVIAIQMASDGADFIEIFQYFLERTGDQDQAFENARRVFRGGVLTGGAPFTKDIVYLDGLLRVHNFLRIIVSTGRSVCLKLLFCGKLDIEDIPVLYELSRDGICLPPRYLPPWVSDMRFLVSYLAYSSFLNSVDLNRLKTHYDQMLANVPRSE